MKPFLFIALIGAGLFWVFSSCFPVNGIQERPNKSGLATQGDTQYSSQKSEDEPLVSLGINSNAEVPEISGMAISSHIPKAIWVHNDSGHAAELFLMKTTGQLLAKVAAGKTKNTDWEAMSRFKLDDKSYLIVADVGDNQRRRKSYQLYVAPELDLSDRVAESKKLPVTASVQTQRLEFVYPDGSKNCEAVAVNALQKEVWLVEKVYVNTNQKTPPGIYVLPLSLKGTGAGEKPTVAKRIANFPIRNVTGMDFSPDGKRLIIRNYVNAHMYTREGDETWEQAIKKTNPETVVLPLQRQGEAVCFSQDSLSLILTSEFTRQPIWQVSLKSYLDKPRRIKKSKSKSAGKR